VDDWKKLFDVNVFGVQRMNGAVLPQMRAQGIYGAFGIVGMLELKTE
jgi:NADP-dependent 3-hydroxy acid dehydrogenase YdfG